MTELTPEDLKSLSVEQRLRLMETVWESLRDQPESLAIPDWHRAELDRRLEGLGDVPNQERSWPEIKERILGSK